MREPRILALDTSSFAASAAVTEGERILGSVGLRTRRPSRDLMPLLDRLFLSLRLGPERIDAFAVTIGPGSFTGLRVGIVAAQTMAHAARRPVLGVGTLEALAAAARNQPAPLCTLLDARRGMVYAATWALSAGWPVPTSPIVDTEAGPWLAQLRWPVTIVGDGLDAHPEAMAEAPEGSRRVEPDPWLAPLAGLLGARALERGEAMEPGSLRPLYVRPADARPPLPPSRESRG